MASLDTALTATRTSNDDARRGFTWAFSTGALLSSLVFVWILNAGRLEFTQRQRYGGDFYDAQARSLLDLRWDVPIEVAGIEAFVTDGKSYIYFGPVPALLRMPVLVVTESLDGRLTQLSMIAAFAVALAFAGRLCWRVRGLVRGRSPFSRPEALATAGYALLLGTGSSVLYLASRPWVYHEATLWGIALSLAAYDAIVGLLVRPSGRALALASLLASAALLTRPTVGGGPVAALGLVLVAHVTRRRLGPFRLLRTEPRRSYAIPLLVAVLVPIALYCYVNYAKFETLFNVPLDRQAHNFLEPARVEVLRSNRNSFLNPAAIPTNLLQQARPDAIGFDGLFPWVTFPSRRATVLGGVRFDVIDRASSVTATMPALVALSVLGLAGIVRARGRRAGLAVLQVPLLGAAAGGAVTLLIIYVAHRYTADFVPLLVLGSLPGLQLLLHKYDAGVRGGWPRAVAGALVLLGLWSCYANSSLALRYQREFAPFVPEELRAELVAFQQDVDRRLGDATVDNVRSGDALPERQSEGDLFIVGECDGLYWSDGGRWFAVERTNATGRFHLRLEFTRRPHGTREPIVANRDDPGTAVVVEHLDDDRIAFAKVGGDGSFTRGPAVPIETGRTYDVEVVLDRRMPELFVSLEDRFVLGGEYSSTTDEFTLGRNPVGSPVAARFSGDVENRPLSRRVCEDIAARAGRSR